MHSISVVCLLAPKHATRLYFSSRICHLFLEKDNTVKTNKTDRLNAAKQKRNMNLKHVTTGVLAAETEYSRNRNCLKYNETSTRVFVILYAVVCFAMYT